MTSVALTGTNHAEDQLVHLRVATLQQNEEELYGCSFAKGGQTKEEVAKNPKQRHQEHVKVNVGTYAGLLGHACPAGVYEYVEDEVRVHMCKLLDGSSTQHRHLRRVAKN